MIQQICGTMISMIKQQGSEYKFQYQIKSSIINKSVNQMNFTAENKKINQQTKKYMKPPLPNLLNTKQNKLIESKGMNLHSFLLKNQKSPLRQKYNSNNHNEQNFYQYLRKSGIYQRKRKSSVAQQKNNSSIKSRISTSQSQQSLNLSSQKARLVSTQIKSQQSNLRQKITSKGWIIYDNQLKKVVLQKGSRLKRQIASLTKIMTCICTIQFCSKQGINMKQLKIKITKRITYVDGTTANLQLNHILTLQDLLYAMMLPSGNDAAIIIAQYIGTLVDILKDGFCKQIIYNADRLHQIVLQNKYQMNLKALDIGMFGTHYGNSHGLNQKNNYSTCEDQIKLCQYSIRNKKFTDIIGSKIYKTKCLETQIQYCWENTHKLLNEGWLGIKTGITPAAGPCLSSWYKGFKNNRHINIIIILLNCNSMEQRYHQTKLLFEYACSKRSY